ncbi:MAG: cobyrinate a,c-diamide synthase [Candidatus Brocadiales bacterium]
MPKLPRILVAGTHSGVGKTTLTLALMVELGKRGLDVQGFKVGPDYIDPGHHTAATGRPSRNLDTWMMGSDPCLETFQHAASGADISVLEGVMGLYDGHRDGTGAGSTAELAKLLHAPVILLVDAKGLARSAAALVMGYKGFDEEVPLAGVILNNVSSESHLKFLKDPIERHCKVHVLGYLSRDSQLTLPERHLGLIPYNEGAVSPTFYTKLTEGLKHVDTDHILDVANSAPDMPTYSGNLFCHPDDQISARIALARDEAFSFYYEDNLDILRSYGAELIPFSPLRDSTLPPNIDAVYIGGGFPELYARELESNNAMRTALRMTANNGVVIYGECGGMMYLLERLIDFKGSSYKMSGVLPGTSQMTRRRQDLGYVTVKSRTDNILCERGETFRGHVFHWSTPKDTPESTTFAYEVTKPGEGAQPDGIFRENVLASYTHVHFAGKPCMAMRLLTSAKRARV